MRASLEAHLGSKQVTRVVYGSIIGLALIVAIENHPPGPAVDRHRVRLAHGRDRVARPGPGRRRFRRIDHAHGHLHDPVGHRRVELLQPRDTFPNRRLRNPNQSVTQRDGPLPLLNHGLEEGLVRLS